VLTVTQISQRACLRSSVDFRTCRDRLSHRAKCPMSRCRSALTCAGSAYRRSSLVPLLRWRVATRSYRRIAVTTAATRPLRRYLRRASGRLCCAELHHWGHDPVFRPVTPEVAGLSPFFSRPFGSEMGARKRRLFFPSG
jgi:hypothetical protein